MSDPNKNCNMHEALVSFLYNETTREEGRRVEAHLAECSSCKQELVAFEHVRGMLQQWQIDEMPVVRVVTEPRKSAVALLRELFGLTPVWAKALGAVAVAMLVLAVMGTEVSIGRGGISARIDLLQRRQAQQLTSPPTGGVANAANDAATMEQVRALVTSMIADRDREQSEELKARLVNLESQLSNMHSADLVKLAQRIQDHQARLKTIERDIDRREGLDLTDILFSELPNKSGRANLASQGGD